MTLENNHTETVETIDSTKDKSKFKQKREQTNALLNKLFEEYPAIFPKAGEGKPVALAIGLHKTLQPIVQEWGFNSITLRAALFSYTHQLRYQRAILHATHRVNLDGSEAELITDEQKQAASDEISKIEAWIAKNRPDKAKKMQEKKNTFKKRPVKSEPKEKVNKPQKAAEIDSKMKDLLSKFNQY